MERLMFYNFKKHLLYNYCTLSINLTFVCQCIIMILIYRVLPENYLMFDQNVYIFLSSCICLNLCCTNIYMFLFIKNLKQ